MPCPEAAEPARRGKQLDLRWDSKSIGSKTLSSVARKPAGAFARGSVFSTVVLVLISGAARGANATWGGARHLSQSLQSPNPFQEDGLRHSNITPADRYPNPSLRRSAGVSGLETLLEGKDDSLPRETLGSDERPREAGRRGFGWGRGALSRVSEAWQRWRGGGGRHLLLADDVRKALNAETEEQLTNAHEVSFQAQPEDRMEKEGCKFYILDLAKMSAALGFKPCDIARVATDPQFAMPLPNVSWYMPNVELVAPNPDYEDYYPFYSLSHQYQQNAGPWYIAESLKHSHRLVKDANQADIIFVYDYCYLMWALSEDHAKYHWWTRKNLAHSQKTGDTPGKPLLAAYQLMMEMLPWQRTNGSQYVFFQPHSGFSFGDDATTIEYYKMLETSFANSLHLLVERSQRTRFSTYSPSNVLVVPYSSTPYPDMPEVNGMRLPETRSKLLYFRGSCAPLTHVGQRMRFEVVKALQAMNDPYIDACCIGNPPDPALKCEEDDERLEIQMVSSRFCLALPGAAQSSQRLSKAFLTGCIPLFLGPPFHTMPLAGIIDYQASSVIINITSTEAWFGTEHKVDWNVNATLPTTLHERRHPKWWLPDAMSNDIVARHTMNDVVEYLHAMSREDLDEKHANVLKNAPLFFYNERLETPPDPPSASDAVVEGMCRYARYGYGKTPGTGSVMEKPEPIG